MIVVKDVERGIGTAEVIEPDLVARLLELLQTAEQVYFSLTNAVSVTSMRK